MTFFCLLANQTSCEWSCPCSTYPTPLLSGHHLGCIRANAEKKKGFFKKLIRKLHAIIKYSYVPSSHTNRQRPKMQAHYG